MRGADPKPGIMQRIDLGRASDIKSLPNQICKSIIHNRNRRWCCSSTMVEIGLLLVVEVEEERMQKTGWLKAKAERKRRRIALLIVIVVFDMFLHCVICWCDLDFMATVQMGHRDPNLFSCHVSHSSRINRNDLLNKKLSLGRNNVISELKSPITNIFQIPNLQWTLVIWTSQLWTAFSSLSPPFCGARWADVAQVCSNFTPDWF